MALNKRTIKKTVAPKPLPARGKEEPETTLGVEPKNVATKSDGLLGKCSACNVFASHSRIDNLCYNCHKEAAGFEFNGKNWTAKKKGRK